VPNSSRTLADAEDSGEEFRRPSGVSCRRTKGRWARRPRASYRHGRGEETAGNKSGLKRGRNYWEETVVGVDFGQRRETI
jgi:hypothetical protein